jgi:DNA-directed RNA polymerase specialized sigma24 family protein
MILDAIENCLIYMDNFDPKKSSNPFAYFTQITYYAFLRRIQKEKKQLQTKYKYIEFLDLENVIRQAHDEGSYDNGFIKYLKQQADTAQRELSDIKKDKKMTRKPKYLQKLNEEPLVNEADHIDVLQISETTEIGEIEYE